MFEFVEIMPNIYQCSIPAGGVLKYSTNIYVIKDEKASLLIDTGYASQVIRESICNGLNQLGIEPEQTRILVTHGHIDHYGNVDYCVSLGMQLLIQPLEHELAIKLETMSTTTAVLCGLNAAAYEMRLQRETASLEKVPAKDQLFKALDANIPYQKVNAGDILTVGGYNFKVFGYKGHSVCQLCLWEESKSFLFSADQLLVDTVPVIVSDRLDQGLLKSFLAGLADIESLNCELILPGHSKALHRETGEIEYAVELIKADYQRLITMLQGWISEQQNGCTALQLASKLYKTTEQEYLEPRLEPKVVMLYKVFSVLEYMHDMGLVKRAVLEGKAVYSI